METVMKCKREKLEKTRTGWTHKFAIHGQTSDDKPCTSEFYIIGNTYPDGRLGEIFLKPAQNDNPFADQWCRALSVCVQRGAPIEELLSLFEFVKFQPAGMTDNPEIPMTHSVADYVVKWLCLKFGSAELNKSRERHV